MREVVVTGIGLVTPLGLGNEVNWKRLINGYSGIKKIETFDTDDLPCKIAGQVPNISNDLEGGLNINDWIDTRWMVCTLVEIIPRLLSLACALKI